jgi:hypothetical protein
MATAFLHRLIVYVLLVYLTDLTTASSKLSSNLNSFNSFLNTLPIDQIPIRTMSYSQPGYRSVAYFVVSHTNRQAELSKH